MQQFVFKGSMGSYPVPPGESRIGSDAACQICIHGEGVLPVHAYVQMDGEKVLIRPADGGAMSGHTGASILVDGKKLSGPAALLGGQDVAIGNVQMRLLAKGIKKPSLWTRRWFRTTVISAGVSLLLLLLGFAYVYFVVLDEATLKDRIKAAIYANFVRDAEIGSIKVRLFEGAIYVDSLKIRERHNLPNAGNDFATIESARVNLSVWPLIRSWFRDYRDLQIVLYKPELNLERSTSDGTLNIQDIVQKFRETHGPVDLGVNNLNFTLEVKDGSIRLNDDFTKIGRTSLESINVTLREPATGDPISLEKCEMKLVSAEPVNGVLTGSGRISLIDSNGMIDLSKISSQGLQFSLTDVDLARLFEHFGYAWAPHAQNFRVVLGKPITGTVGLKIDDLKHIRFNGHILSDSLLSIHEANNPPLGNIPMSLDADVLLADSGNGYRPQNLDLKLLSGAHRSDLNNPEAAYLTFEARGKLNPGGVSNYSVRMQCGLDELCGTDVGRRLGLEGRLGGRLDGSATLILDANGFLQIDSRMNSEESYVMVWDPAEEKKPPSSRKPPVRQPLPLSFDCHASATPGTNGELSEIVIESFSLTAPSFTARSELKGMVSGLGHDGELEAHARFNLNLKGREFFTEFAPILKLFGFDRPVEEILDLQILVWGKNNTIRVGARGKASRQWGPDPAPVKLDSIIQYNAKAAGNQKPAKQDPVLSLVLEVASDEGKPLFVRVEALCGKTDTAQYVNLESYDKDDIEHKTPLAGLTIKSDVETLRQRFKPYIEGYLQRLDESHGREESGWLKLYTGTTLSGELAETGRITIQHVFDPKSTDPDNIKFDMDLAGTKLEIKTPARAIRAVTGDGKGADAGPEVDGKGGPVIWAWKEDAVTVGLKGTYSQRLSGSKEEPDKERLDVERLDVKGSMGSFRMGMNNLDVFKLLNLRSLPKLTWTDCVRNLRMSGQLNPPAYDFARSIALIPENHLISGTLALQIDFDQEKDTLDLQKFVFKQTDQKRKFYVSNLDVTGSLLRVRDLSARFLPAQADGTPFSERVANFLDQGGPVALLDHLGENLAINSLQVETGPFIDLLKKDFPDVRRAPALIAGILNNDWRPEGTWHAAGINFRRIDDQKNRKWELIGALQNDFKVFGAAPHPGEARPPIFSFNSRWSLAVGIAVFIADNTVAIKGDALFDQAGVNAVIPALNYEYKKAPGVPSKVEIECSYVHGLHTQVSKLKLIGAPLAMEIKDFETTLSSPDKRSYSVAELSIEKGPLPCLLTVQKLDPAADAMQMRLFIPKLDLPYLSGLPDLKPPESVKLAGALKDVSVGYKGSLATLQSMIEASSSLAAQFPHSDVDIHARALNPETDTLDFDAQLDGVRMTASAGKGRSASMNLGGKLHVTPRDLSWQNLNADIDYVAGDEGSVKQAFTIPNLNVSSSDAKLNLVRALKAPGVPLNLGARVVFSTPFSVPAMFTIYHTVMTAFGAPPIVGDQNELKFASMEQLIASGSLRAPSIITGARKVEIMGEQNFTLKGLKLNTPQLTTDLFGGKLVLNDAEFDLTKGSVFPSDARFSTRGVAFTFRGNLNGADVEQLLGGPDPGKNSYAVTGRIDSKIELQGPDFEDRLNWKGFAVFKISNLLCETPPHRSGVIEIPVAPWSAPMASLDPRIFSAMMKAANFETVNLAELAKDLPVSDSLKPLNGLLVAAQVYLARTCGVEFNRYEFDPITPTMVIENGAAEIRDPVRLSGRDSCVGFGLEIDHFRYNLADETFADANVYPFALPKSAESRMHLEKWGVDLRKDYLRDLANGKLPLRITGRLGVPVTAYPWADLKRWSRRALFNAEKIDDLEMLQKAREYFVANWGGTEEDLAAGAALADRAGAGLPGTVSARNVGETLIDRVPGLPHRLSDLFNRLTPAISPLESLRALLYEPPDTPPAPPKPANAPAK